MDRSIEQALVSLLPTQNADLPQPLVELASSLLAQSRHRASTLKADEEIARPYACSHLACERLKIQLNLPPLDPRPPVPPRLYRRLYQHLDRILPNSSVRGRGTPGRPRKNAGGLGTPSKKDSSLFSSVSSTARGSSSKTDGVRPGIRQRGLGDFATSSPSKKNKGKKLAQGALPLWMRPSLRYLCDKLGSSEVGSIVMAGTEAIVAPHGQRNTDEWVAGHLSPLLAALYLYVWSSVSMPEGVDEARYVRARAQVVEALNSARSCVRITAAGAADDDDDEDREKEEDAAWDGWQKIRASDIDSAALAVNRHGWLESDWAKGIEDLIWKRDEARDRGSGGGDDDDNDNNDDGDRQGGIQTRPARRADSMFQDRFDYLSERKRKEYAGWKAGIMRRIKNLEKGNDEMEIDS